jgi:YVTN family beta-propeller protein
VRLAALLLTAFAAISAFAQSGTLLVLEKSDRTLAIIDPGSKKVLTRVPAGEDPHEIVASDDGHYAYISNYGAFGAPQHTLTIVDLRERKSLGQVDLGGLLAPHGLAFADGKVYFTAEGSKSIGRFDPSTKKVDWVLGIGQNRTHMLVVRKNAIFTSNVNSDTIGFLTHDDKADVSHWTEADAAVGKGPEGFDVSPDGHELWAANSHDGSVSVIDVASRKVTNTFDIHTKFANRVKFTPDGKLVLISDLGTGELVILDASGKKEIKRVKLGNGVAGILLAPDGAHAYVAASPDSKIVIFDLHSLTAVGEIPVGKGPDGMAWASAALILSN